MYADPAEWMDDYARMQYDADLAAAANEELAIIYNTNKENDE